jgi:flagellar biosynthesis chaperone FliJ
MKRQMKSLWTRYAAMIALALGLFLPNAFAAQVEQESAANDMSEATSRPIGEPLTDFEKLELYHRRYSNAANSIAQLFKQLNQKIQEVSLAVKTVEAKDNSHNRRLLETKLRQLESTRSSYNVQYSQLHSQMQNEYRNYMAMSANLKAKHDTVDISKNPQDTAEGRKDAKTQPAKVKASRVKDQKGTKVKTGEPETQYLQANENAAKDPRIMDMDTTELRERRDGSGRSNTSLTPSPTSGPALNAVH